MIRTYTILLFLVVLCSSAFAQSKDVTLIVKFGDKGNAKYKLHEPTEYLSARSVERRLTQNIPIEETDLPVNAEYIQALKEQGADVFYTSKWLNIAIARINNADIASVNKLPFVAETSISTVFPEHKSTKSSKHTQNEKFQRLIKKRLKSSSTTNVFDYGMAAHQAQQLRINELHNQGYSGQGMIMAIIDAGFNSADKMDVFDSLYATNRILGTRDFVEPGNDVYETTISGHGTSVLSTIGANLPGAMIGTAPHASFYLLRSEDAAAEYLMEEYFWINAAEYADSVGVDVINTSLGYSTFDNPGESHTYSDMDGNTTPITIAADLAAKKGILVVNSAGNEGSNSWQYITAPADGDSVLTVGAVDENGLYAYFSSTGPTADGRIKPDASALGYNATVAYPGGGIGGGSGTSFSSPIMAGAAACLWQANPTYTNMEILNAIRQSGNQASNQNNQVGWGVPDFVIANAILVGTIIKPAPEININVFPNPFIDSFITEVNALKPVDVNILLIDFKGTIVMSQGTYSLRTGSNLITIDNLGHLAPGMYVLQVQNPEFIKSVKILK